MNWANWYWLCWIAIGFGLPEALAIALGRREFTLSYSVWQLRNVCPQAFYALWLVLIAWLTYHFFTGKTNKENQDEQR